MGNARRERAERLEATRELEAATGDLGLGAIAEDDRVTDTAESSFEGDPATFDGDVRTLLGRAYAVRNDWPKAIAHYREAQKLSPYSDRAVFNLTGWISGHTLKHLAAAVSTFVVLRMLSTTSFRRA